MFFYWGVHIPAFFPRGSIWTYSTITFYRQVNSDNDFIAYISCFKTIIGIILWVFAVVLTIQRCDSQYSFIPGCNDVFKVPFFSISFAKELIEECERFGEWSSGDTRDERLSGGYEPVPTQDIHFTQIGFTNPWRYILRTFVRPVAREYYTGYNLEGVVGNSNFSVVMMVYPLCWSVSYKKIKLN